MAIETRYRNNRTGAIYRLTYQAQSGAHTLGIPHDAKTDIINLELASKTVGVQKFIVTSLFDLEEKFTAFEWRPIKGQLGGSSTPKDLPVKE